MATNFPNSLDSLTNPATTDQLNSPSHAAQHANANDAIEQLQAKVGVNSSAVTTSHDYKIAQLEAAITAGVSGTKLIYQDVRNQSGASLTKGTPVRVTGSDGASGKLLIASATNATESGSSKTFGLVSSTISNNSNGQVVTNGLLENVDTTGAVDGDPVWLGVNGAKIFGLVNKPSAPAHLVYLGVVVRGGQQNTGSIFVSIQNGFELHELHNVAINQVQNKNALVYDSTTELWKNYDLSNDFVLSGDLQNSLGDYIPLNVLGQPSGPAALDADGNLIVPENKIIIEGATADANELTIQAPDVTSDITVTLPNATGTLALTSDITTAVNNLVNSAPAVLDTLNELATALGNDANFATTTATSIGNKVSKAGGDVITPSSASVKGLVIRAATSQTANLQQWETGAGTVAALVDGNGQFETGYFYTNFGGGSYKNSGLITINPANNIVPLVIAGVSGQTSDLQQWKNSAGTVLSSITPSGDLNFGSNLWNIKSSGTNVIQWQPTQGSMFLSYGSSNPPITIQGSSGQTANLTNWQNSSGTILAYIRNDGLLNTPAILSNYIWIGGFQSGVNVGITPTVLNEKALVVKGLASQTANLQEWQNSAGTVLSAVNALGQGVFTNTTPITASAVSQAITAVSFTSTTATYTFSATAQTISVGEYVTVFGITPSGYNGTYQVTAVATVSAGTSYSFTVANNTNATVTVGTGYFFPSASVSISTQNKAHTGLIIKAVSGQTASTMEIQNSLGQPVTWWDSTGGMTASQAVISTLYSGGFMNTGTRGYFNATTFSPSVSPIVVRGTTSQTADLQQWQNSAGTVLSKVDSTGAMFTTTAPANTNTTQVATTAYVQTELADLVNSAPATLDTLKELSDALGADANFATTVSTALGTKITASSVDVLTNKTIGLGTGITSATGYDDISGFFGQNNIAIYQAGLDKGGKLNISSEGVITVANSGIGYTSGIVTTSGGTRLVITVGGNTLSGTLAEFNAALSDADFAPIASPAFTGTPTAPTAAVGTDSTQVATTAFVIDQIDASTQPGALYQTTAPTSPEIGQIWIDSDDNVTVFDSNIVRRQPFTATAGQTNFVTTVPFIDGFEQVYFNGLLLLKTTDYTTSGTNTVILGSAAAVGDIIEVVTITNLNSVNTYTQAETDALLAANTSVAPLSISANTNLLAKKRYFVTSASALTLTLPASPALNDEIQILDASGNASTYNITVARNGNLINGNAGNLIIDNNGGWYTLLYTGATYGWKVG